MTHARIGEMVVSRDPDEELVALGLGSCVALVMIDAHARVAGLAHVMLPAAGADGGPAGKYADTAVPELLARVTALGAAQGRLRIAIAGGAAMFGADGSDIGARNTEAIHGALTSAGLDCEAAETGGAHGRTVRVSVGSGTATIRVAGGACLDLLRLDPESADTD